MAVKINWEKIRFELEKPLERAFRQKALDLATRHFEKVKDEFLEKFYTHEVSQELLEGAEHESEILGIPGSLYGFIGFQAGTNPIKDLYQFLDKYIRLDKNPRYIKSRIAYQFTTLIPDNSSIAQATKMPWGTHASWAFAIESGISGLNQYLSLQRYEDIRGYPPKSPLGRSHAGIQIEIPLKKTKGPGDYQPREYMSNLLEFLRKAIKEV